MRNAIVMFAAAVVLSLFLGGCSHYYKVRDPLSDKIYYTDDLDNEGGGAILFHDIVTRQEIRLQSSEVIRITKDEYLANIHGR
jgi:hypothetical protein